MGIQAKHPNGSWYTVWQTQKVSDIHSSRIFSPHFDVCIIHVRYIDCEGKREMWIVWQLVFFMYKSDNLWWNELDIVLHVCHKNDVHQSNFYFTSIVLVISVSFYISLVNTMLLFVKKGFHVVSTDKVIWKYHHNVLIPPIENIHNILYYKY